MKSILKFPAFLFLSGMIIFISCKKEKSCESCRGTNKPPIANAGKDTNISLTADSVTLDGRASTDIDGSIVSYAWAKILGPDTFNIIKPKAAVTAVNKLVKAIYQFELTVADNGGLSTKDTIVVTVNAAGIINGPPVANAGKDTIIILPINSVTLDGIGSSDPDNNITNYAWTKISGPSSFNIVNANVVQTQITNLVQGIYRFELKVTDAGGLFSKDTMVVTVNVQTSACDNSNRPQINAQLIPLGTLLGGVAVASAGNKILYAGGGGSSFGGSSVDIFDIVTQTWSTAQLSVARRNIAAISAGNKIFFAGGEYGDGAFDDYYSTVDIYDVSTNTWTVASLSQTRSNIAATVIGNKVFFAGGEKDLYYTTSDVVDIYDIAASSWTTARLSEPRSYISAATLNNNIYFAGGHAEDRWYQSPSKKIDIYNNNTNTWSTSSLLVNSGIMSSIAVNNNIYWAGGCPVEIRNANTGNSSVAYLSKPGGYNSVQKDGKIVFIEGGDKFDIYDIATNTWSIGVLPINIYLSSIISVNNIIYVSGAPVGGGASIQLWKLEF